MRRATIVPVRVIAADYDNQVDEFSLDAPIVTHDSQQWSNYVRGVVVKHTCSSSVTTRLAAMDMVISGNIAAGRRVKLLRASLEVAVGAEYFQQLYHLPLDGAQIALNGRRPRTGYPANCGIMDQLISKQAKKDHALLIDCRTLGTPKAVSMPKSAPW